MHEGSPRCTPGHSLFTSTRLNMQMPRCSGMAVWRCLKAVVPWAINPQHNKAGTPSHLFHCCCSCRFSSASITTIIRVVITITSFPFPTSSFSSSFSSYFLLTLSSSTSISSTSTFLLSSSPPCPFPSTSHACSSDFSHFLRPLPSLPCSPSSPCSLETQGDDSVLLPWRCLLGQINAVCSMAHVMMQALWG